ncbi:MAG: dihydroorotate dehydrogenase electron transfer subunit [Planctomycetaceae bacterium]|nr:dihydroorotate dehydrogenase electron transfer subunit [Planctomycetaceae bacterium]
MPIKEVQKGLFEAEVLSNQQIRRCFYRLNLQFDALGSHLFEHVIPGQFLELDLSLLPLPPAAGIPEELQETAARPILLRRPFSFSDVVVSHNKSGTYVKVEIIYCVLGPATVRMTSLRARDRINVLGPLGNGFSIPENLSMAILAAGGMGSPPILHLASYLKQHHPAAQVISFVGARTCEDLPFTIRIGNIKGLALEEFEMLQVPSQISTDDGSAGFRGFLTDNLRRWLGANKINSDSAVIYACGPEAMLAATAKLADDFSLACQVSMERMMACGIGLCQSCAVEVRNAEQSQYRLCCKDGPVFDAKKVVFLTQ